MVTQSDSVIETIKKYVNELRNHNIPVQEVILFGSKARGDSRGESDIDIAIISDVFSGDRFEDRRRIVPYRRKIDSRIEPIPFSSKCFSESGNLIDEIKKNGIKLTI